MVLQLVYAALTSRLLAPPAFGAYAVGLSAVALLGMISGTSLGLSAARRDHDSEALDRSLLTLAAATSTIIMCGGLVLAGAWQALWEVAGAAQVTRVLMLSLPAVALGEVLAGILRRSGKTATVAWRTALSQAVGMAVGLGAILATRADWALGATPVAAAVATAGLLLAAVPRNRRRLGRPSSDVALDVLYAMKAAGMNLLRYSTYTLPPWAVGRFAGAAALGAYNRATAVLVTPLEAIQRALTYTIFPELRPGGVIFSRKGAFTDIAVTLTWIAAILGGLGYFAAPPFLSLLLGAGWELAAGLGGLAVLLAVVPMVYGLLASALEALGRFRITWFGWLLTTMVILIGVGGTVRLSSPYPAIWGLLLGKSISIPVYALGLHASDHLDLRQWVRGAAPILLGQALVCAGLSIAATELGSTNPAMILVVIVVAVSEVSLLFFVRDRTPLSRVVDVVRQSLRHES